jgi:hypothetical protein
MYGMKKSIYACLIAMVSLAFLASSCHKDNLKPMPTSKQQGGSSSVAAGGGSQASVPAYDPANPPSCPSHGGSH